MGRRRSLTIIMVTNNYTPYSGGVVSSIISTAHELRTLGHRVILVSLDFLGKGEQEDGVYRIPSCARFVYRGNIIAVPFAARRHLSRLFEKYKPDIVHVHHPFILGSYAAKIAQKRHIPVIFTHHTLYEHYVHYVPFLKALLKPLAVWWVKRFCLGVHKVIVPSKSVEAYVQRRYSLQGATILPSGILRDFVCSEPPKLKIIKGPVQLLSVSRFMPEKNIPFLLHVVADLADKVCLTLVGYGEEQERLEAYAFGELGLKQRNVRFVIKPEKRVIKEWYEKSHLFIFASQTETQGLVLAEAMASGTPVIALRGPGVVDIIETGVNGYVVDSLDEMVQVILKVASDPPLYAHLQRNAYCTARQYYPKDIVLQLCDLYRDQIRLNQALRPRS